MQEVPSKADAPNAALRGKEHYQLCLYECDPDIRRVIASIGTASDRTAPLASSLGSGRNRTDSRTLTKQKCASRSDGRLSRDEGSYSNMDLSPYSSTEIQR